MINYSYQRIIQILKSYDCHLEKANHLAYKANRHEHTVTLYRLVQNDGKVLLDKVSLKALRSLFTDLGYPLKQEKPSKHRKRG